MPFTSYALFKAIRSHRIDSPSALATATTERPNACNLCHLDRSLGWTAVTLARWKNQAFSSRDLEPDARQALERAEPRALFELLAGDAATRAVAAAAFGRADAESGANPAADAIALARLLDDPYAAVRKVACDSLRTLAGFEAFRCDFVAAADVRRSQTAEALRLARAALASGSGGGQPDGGAAFAERVQALIQVRDHTPTTISE
jgi:hypothetical protein